MAIHPLQQENENTLEYILRVEPRLASLLGQAKQADGGERWQEYSRLKRAASVLVGWGAQQAELRTHWAYDAFIVALDAALPVYEGQADEDE